MAKLRLDQLLVALGHFPSRERAQSAIMAGLVKVGDAVVTKSGQAVAEDAPITVLGQPHPYVSRGALKLERALEVFGVDPAGRVVLDAGASTGGFTDLVLKRDAKHVYAVDVGYGQLAWSLRQDERVTVRERTNVRYMTAEDLGDRPSLIVADLSFISLGKVLPAFAALLAPDGEAVTLVKPQFEAGREAAKGGVVRDAKVHQRVIEAVAESAKAVGWALVGVTHSPIKGPEGNMEFLAHWKPAPAEPVGPEAIAEAVRRAHEELNA
jgi:23S rRNA (cytidine1920-2'-O)/16S rRNA (cytidine1409-2'-O)-methyltransferase